MLVVDPVILHYILMLFLFFFSRGNGTLQIMKLRYLRSVAPKTTKVLSDLKLALVHQEEAIGLIRSLLHFMI